MLTKNLITAPIEEASRELYGALKQVAQQIEQKSSDKQLRDFGLTLQNIAIGNDGLYPLSNFVQKQSKVHLLLLITDLITKISKLARLARSYPTSDIKQQIHLSIESATKKIIDLVKLIFFINDTAVTCSKKSAKEEKIDVTPWGYGLNISGNRVLAQINADDEHEIQFQFNVTCEELSKTFQAEGFSQDSKWADMIRQMAILAIEKYGAEMCAGHAHRYIIAGYGHASDRRDLYFIMSKRPALVKGMYKDKVIMANLKPFGLDAEIADCYRKIFSKPKNSKMFSSSNTESSGKNQFMAFEEKQEAGAKAAKL